MFKKGDVVELDKDFVSEFFGSQKKLTKIFHLEFDKPYVVSIEYNDPNGISFVDITDMDGKNLSKGYFAGRFKLYKEERKQETKDNGVVYCNCSGPWIENYACGKSFKVCKSCGKEVI